MTKREKITYWVLTALFLLPMAGSGVPELLVGGPAATAASIVHLGYPLYLMRILGLAKILGAVAIVTNRSRTLAEWAYAGFVFDLVGAVASHLGRTASGHRRGVARARARVLRALSPACGAEIASLIARVWTNVRT